MITADKTITLHTVSCQRSQSTTLLFHFVLFHKHLQKPLRIYNTAFIRHNFLKVNMKFVESEVRVNCLFSLIFSLNCMLQISIQQRQSPIPFIMMNIFTSFIKKSQQSVDHYITHYMFAINITNFNWYLCPAFKKQITDCI